MINFFIKLAKWFISLLILLITQIGWAQFKIPEKPVATKQTSVYDYANLLLANQKQDLERRLINYADTTSNQIVIAIIPSLEGENIGILTPQWAQEWGIGDKDNDNGVFILLAVNERKIWISPGYGLEHILTAGINGEIIRNVIIPNFKQGDYYQGLYDGTNALMELFSGTYKAKKQIQNEFPAGAIIFFVILILFLLFLISSKGGKNGGNMGGNRGGFDLMDAILLSSLGRSSGSGGFGSTRSGGGFSGGFGGGFGGGGFSGGGAGGSW
jgi:uncharacterized protein